MLESNNGGSVWNEFTNALWENGGEVDVDPNNNSILWSTGESHSQSIGVGKSMDGGTTWDITDLGSGTWGYALVIDPTNTDIVYVGGEGSSPNVYKTTNGGGSWAAASTGLSGNVYDLDLNPSNTSIVYAASSSGCYKSTNAGSNWTDMGLDKVTDVLVDTNDPNTIYAGTESGVFKSINAGSDWVEMNDGLDNTDVTYLEMNYTDEYLFAAIFEESIYRWALGSSGVNGGNIPSIKGIFFASPNPTVGRTTIQYQLLKNSRVNLSVFDIHGKLVRTLVNREIGHGIHNEIWDGMDEKGRVVPSGTYFYKLSIPGSTYTRKLILLK